MAWVEQSSKYVPFDKETIRRFFETLNDHTNGVHKVIAFEVVSLLIEEPPHNLLETIFALGEVEDLVPK